MTGTRRATDWIFVDEIGIEIGIYGDFRLRTAFQPIFRHRAGTLAPVGIEGLVAPYRDGAPVASEEFFRSVPPQDALFVESLSRALHLRNHHNAGVPSLQLFFNFDPRANNDLDGVLRDLRAMAGDLQEIGLDPRLLVCELTDAAALDEDILIALTDVMRGLGIRIAVDDFGSGHSTFERVGRFAPDIVKVEGALFRRVSEEAAAVRLLSPVLETIRSIGAEVLIKGIETPAQLRLAVDLGAGLLQGYLLGRPALAGTIFDETPRPLARYLERGGDNVVRLFR